MMLLAIFSPISSIKIKSSKLAFSIKLIDLKALTNVFATVSPTYLIPNPNKTLLKGFAFYFSIPPNKFDTDLSAILSKVRI